MMMRLTHYEIKSLTICLIMLAISLPVVAARIWTRKYLQRKIEVEDVLILVASVGADQCWHS